MPSLLQYLPFDFGIKAAKVLLEAQGFGGGGDFETSGETGVFNLIKTQAPVVLDIGGFVGGYSAALLRRIPGASIYVFEPSVAHLAQAKLTLAAWPQVRFFNTAISDFEGTATLYKPTEVSGLASLSRRRLDHHKLEMNLEETVRCTTVDAVLAAEQIERVDLMKIDVEGHELDVLKGAAGALAKKAIRIIQFEFGGANLDTRTTVQDFYYLFNAAGYDLHIVRPRGDLVRLRRYREMYEQPRTTNYVAIAGPPEQF